MKRKLVYLPFKYEKCIIDDINAYFDKGYEIESVLNSSDGYYVFFVLDDEYYSYTNTNKKYNRQNLIEESVNNNWSRTTTKDVKSI